MSTEEENKLIAEGNKAIAKFMGAQRSKIDGDTRYFRFSERHAGTIHYAFYPWDFKYHSSWDWLMPVLNKIKRYGVQEQETEERQYEAENQCKKLYETMIYGVACLNIQMAWQAVVQFIEWYNKQK